MLNNVLFYPSYNWAFLLGPMPFSFHVILSYCWFCDITRMMLPLSLLLPIEALYRVSVEGPLFWHRVTISPQNYIICHAHIRHNQLVSHVETTFRHMWKWNSEHSTVSSSMVLPGYVPIVTTLLHFITYPLVWFVQPMLPLLPVSDISYPTLMIVDIIPQLPPKSMYLYNLGGY